jgi:sugar phosphate isomerase/epimerase
MKTSNNKVRIGLGSYSYRYNAGFDGFRPEEPMTVVKLLEEAHKLGYHGIQLCENMRVSYLSNEELAEIKQKAQELGLFIEVGMNDLSAANLTKNLHLVELLSSKYLRIVLGATKIYPEKERDRFRENAARVLKDALPQIRALGIIVGIENHFDLPSLDLVRLIEETDDESIGLIFDSTNCLGFIERPEKILELFGPRLVGIHIKDYEIFKISGGYRIAGVCLGEGLLDVAGILKKAMDYNFSLSITLEMPIHHIEGQGIEDITAWERIAVERSTKYLFKAITDLNFATY